MSVVTNKPTHQRIHFHLNTLTDSASQLLAQKHRMNDCTEQPITQT